MYCSINRWEESGNLNDRPRGRPPRCTTPAQDQQITAAAADSPFTNAVAIRDALHLEVSATTVRRRLHSQGIPTVLLPRKNVSLSSTEQLDLHSPSVMLMWLKNFGTGLSSQMRRYSAPLLMAKSTVGDVMPPGKILFDI